MESASDVDALNSNDLFGSLRYMPLVTVNIE